MSRVLSSSSPIQTLRNALLICKNVPIPPGNSGRDDRGLGNGFAPQTPDVSTLSSQCRRDLSLYDVGLNAGLCPLPTGLGSAPHIRMAGPADGEVQLVCTADGWFPEPRVHWEDSSGEALLTLSEHHIPDEDGLFRVEATLVVRIASAGTVSCSVHNPVLAEEKGAVLSVPGQPPPPGHDAQIGGRSPGCFFNQENCLAVNNLY